MITTFTFAFCTFNYSNMVTKTKKTKINGQYHAIDAVKLSLIKSELNYFKGLSIMLTVLILCVFIAFGALFSAMYLETRITREIFQVALKDQLPPNLQAPIAGVIDVADEVALAEEKEVLADEETPCCGESASTDKIDFSQWLSFSKYGVKVLFPETWTYLDRPEQKHIHLFADGGVRDGDSTEAGNVVISFIKDDIYKNYPAESLAISGVMSKRYVVPGEDVLIVPLDGQFLRVAFDGAIEADVRDGIIYSLELTK